MFRVVKTIFIALRAWRSPRVRANRLRKTRFQSKAHTVNRRSCRKLKNFFGDGAQGLGSVVKAAFRDQGRPNAYIKGEEVSGAVVVGLRYGTGTLSLANGESRTVYWQGPSIGFDLGGNASKAFILVYNLPDVNTLFQRFPGVEGSLYFVGGVGVNYNQSGDTILAPIRFGVGWRQGANVGYLHMTAKKSWNPF